MEVNSYLLMFVRRRMNQANTGTMQEVTPKVVPMAVRMEINV